MVSSRQALEGTFSERCSGMFSGLMEAVITRVYVYVNKSSSYTRTMSVPCMLFCNKKVKGGGEAYKRPSEILISSFKRHCSVFSRNEEAHVAYVFFRVPGDSNLRAERPRAEPRARLPGPGGWRSRPRLSQEVGTAGGQP